MRLLSLRPDRLGHATFLDAEAKQFVRYHNIAIEICLTSNLLCVHPYPYTRPRLYALPLPLHQSLVLYRTNINDWFASLPDPPLHPPPELYVFYMFLNLPPSLALTFHHRCKTVQDLKDHHMRYHYALNHPIAICVSLTLSLSPASLLSPFTSH